MKAILFVALFVMTSALTMVESSIQLEDGPATSETQSGAIGIVDVPTYRVGDEWVYDTKFDVAQLLAQANVSASLNTLTGDTVNEVTDVFYATDNNGDTVLARMRLKLMEVSHLATVAPPSKASPDGWKLITKALIFYVLVTLQPSPATSPLMLTSHP